MPGCGDFCNGPGTTLTVATDAEEWPVGGLATARAGEIVSEGSGATLLSLGLLLSLRKNAVIARPENVDQGA